jgi:hypothetical protein
MIGLPIKDTQCGAKLFKRSLAEQLFTESFMTRWLFDVEIFFRLKNLFGKEAIDHMKEMALSAWEDVEGSKLKMMDSIKIPLMLSKIAYNYYGLKRAA